jgi:hypothetical protein
VQRRELVLDLRIPLPPRHPDRPATRQPATRPQPSLRQRPVAQYAALPRAHAWQEAPPPLTATTAPIAPLALRIEVVPMHRSAVKGCQSSKQ